MPRTIMNATKVPEPSIALPQTAWQAILCKTVIDIFSTMVGVAVALQEEITLPVPAQVTGVVGIAGSICAIFSLRCSVKSSIKIASQMLGISPDDPGARKAASDAVGEVCNIVAGSFKAKIGLGDKCMLSLPTIITGGDYAITSGTGRERIEFILLFEAEPVWITLEIRQ